MPVGTVKFFDATKAYGFVTPDDTRPGMITLSQGQRLSHEEGDRRGEQSSVNCEVA